MSFAKNIRNNYSQKLCHSAKRSTTDATKTASKRAIQKKAEGNGDLIGHNIANKITSASKIFPKELDSQMEGKTEIPKKRYISPQKRQETIDELKLV